MAVNLLASQPKQLHSPPWEPQIAPKDWRYAINTHFRYSQQPVSVMYPSHRSASFSTAYQAEERRTCSPHATLMTAFSVLLQIFGSPSTPILENPEYQTRWYFKYFLGKREYLYILYQNIFLFSPRMLQSVRRHSPIVLTVTVNGMQQIIPVIYLLLTVTVSGM
jgi:hypothetical protein